MKMCRVRWLRCLKCAGRRMPGKWSSSTVRSRTGHGYQLCCEQADIRLQESEWAHFSGEQLATVPISRSERHSPQGQAATLVTHSWKGQ